MRNRMMHRMLKRTTAVMLSVVMAAGTCSMPAAAAKKGKETKDKNETVYVNADPDGTVNKITVSDWLSNLGGSDRIDDMSELEDIRNVKGDEDYSDNGDGSITWNAGGKEIYYEGTTDKDLPVNVKVSYFLDGKKMDPSAMAGKSGKVRIRFDYENSSYEKVRIKKNDYTIATPFTAITAMILPSENFDNIEVVNGQVINDGNKNFVLGIAMPGLEDSLSLSTYKKLQDVDIPSYVEVTADATDFELSMTATAITNGLLEDIDTGDLKDVDDLEKDMDKLTDASTKLVDGTRELADGVGELSKGFDKYMDGVEKASDGTDELYQGLKKLDKNSIKLEQGSKALTDGLKKLKKGSKTLKEGLEQYTSGVDTLDKNLEKAADGSSQLAAGSKKLVQGIETYTEGVEQLQAGIKKLNEFKAVLNKIKLSKEDMEKLKKVSDLLTKVIKTSDNLNSHIEELEAIVKKFREKGKELNTEALKKKLNEVKEAAEAIGKKASAEASESAAKAANEAIDKANGKIDANTKKANDTISEAGKRIRSANERIESAKDDLEDIDLDSIEDEKVRGKIRDALDELKTVDDSLDTVAEDKVDKVSKDDCPVTVDVTSDLNEAIKDLNEEIAEYQGYIDQLKALVDDDLKKEIAELQEALKDMDLKTYIASIKKYSEDVKEKIDLLLALQQKLPELEAGIDQMNGGAEQLVSKNKDLNEAGATLAEGLKTLNTGLTQMSGGADTLSSKNKLLNQGASDIYNGSGTLFKGAGTLTSGLDIYTDGVNLAMKGTGQLASGMGLLVTAGGKVQDGIGELGKGTETLADGMAEFDEEGIQKLSDLAGDDLVEVINRFRAVKKADGKYDSFAGKSDKASGKVRFIIETDEISTDDE